MNQTLSQIHTGASTLSFLRDQVPDLMANFRFNIASIPASELHACLNGFTDRLVQTDISDYDFDLVSNLSIELETLKSNCRFNMLAIRPAEVHAALHRVFELTSEAIAQHELKTSPSPSPSSSLA